MIKSWIHIIHDNSEYPQFSMDTIMDIQNSIMDIHNYQIWWSIIQL